jgi:RNA polymerase sigma-70 factor (ECF subfamily)
VSRGLPRFRGDERGFRSWTFTIARYRVTDDQRRTARRLADPLPAHPLEM